MKLAFTHRRNLVLIVINLVGFIGYLRAVFPSWAIPIERENGIHSITGEPLLWALASWPILALFFVLNLSWGAFILFRKRWEECLFWVSALLLWEIALWIDIDNH